MAILCTTCARPAHLLIWLGSSHLCITRAIAAHTDKPAWLSWVVPKRDPSRPFWYVPVPTPAPTHAESLDSCHWTSVCGLEQYCLLLVATVAMYGSLVALVRWKTQPGTAQRHAADRFLCCWRDLYAGRAFGVYSCIFGPLVLAVHACRIYLPSCFSVYASRLRWWLCGRCFAYFTDEEFPPDASSLGNVGGDDAHRDAGKDASAAVWVRAMDLGRASAREPRRRPELHGTDMCLFQGKIEPCDIVQGALGDCWLLAAIAAVSEDQNLIKSLFLTREVNPQGKYYVRLYDLQQKAWRVIVVDDFIPCQADRRACDQILRDAAGVPVVRYAKPNGSEIWAMILEKAFAKLCGSYANIEGGITEWGVACMTGGDAWRFENSNGVWMRSDLVPIEDNDKRACGFSATREKHNSDQLFQLIRYYHRNGAVLCCGGVREAGESKGLVAKHAFSLLKVCSVRKSWDSKQYFRLVQIRNPWGTGEWTGAWSDHSHEWEQYPYVKQKIHKMGHESSDDGLYWMQWEDFCEYWSYVGCVDCTVDIFSLKSPVYDEADRLGPLRACLKGCFEYWCCCLGCRRYFWHHDASSEELSPGQFGRTCGADQKGVYCRVCERETVFVDDGLFDAGLEQHELQA